MFVWSSLGSILVGAAVTLARRKRKVAQAPLELQPIPEDCNRISVWTEHFSGDEDGSSTLAQDRYVIQSTPFKVWSVLDTQESISGSKPAGWRIYHITHLRFNEAPAVDSELEEGQLQDRFYGTLGAVDPEGTSAFRDRIGRGAIMAVRKCSVGGASNGVETGEVHYSTAPILNFRFEYASVEKRV